MKSLLSYIAYQPICTIASVVIILSILMPVMSSAQTENAILSRTVSLNLNQFVFTLSSAPRVNTTNARTTPQILDLPMPDGTTESFHAVESSIMHADFAIAYPDFKTYTVQGILHPELSGRISITPYGFNAVILSPEGFIHIRPLDLNSPIQHRVSLVNLAENIIECHVVESVEKVLNESAIETAMATNGATKRTYTLAIVGTGEFHDANGGSVGAATAVAMTTVNAIQAIFERELSVGFTLLTPFIYNNAATDPFNPGLDMVLEAAQAVEANFSGQGYDLGHVFHDSDQGAGNLGGGGVAGLGVVCIDTMSGTGFQKAGGWSGSFDNVTAGWIKLATHEFGHMFDMPHTFNGDGSNCQAPNHPLNTAYEIGSGTSIMSYQGICTAPYNIPSSGLADHYFHANSLDRAVTYIATQTCHTGTASGNIPPVVNADPCNAGAFSIPVSTPFRLTGSATDADGDQIYYSWEQYDEDGVQARPTHGFIGATAASSTIAPLFRSYPPTTTPSRTFPNIDLVKAGQYASSFEPLPTVARALNFRLTARDWKAGGGGIDCKPLAVTVSATGPLTVTAPNGGENLTASNPTTVTWSNNTSALSATVNIRLSIDGGNTYPYTLAAATANDGSQSVTIPAGVANTTTARMMVESAANTCVVFFDISNGDFTISSNCQVATSNICPTTSLTLPVGDGGLNLALNQYYGSEISQANYNLDGTSPTTQIANLTVEGGTICQTPGTGRTNTLDFTVSTTGTYSFSADPNDPDFIIFSIFSANGFNAANPCPNFLGSNSNGAYGLSGDAVNVNLTACTTYKLIMWSLDETIDGIISINGSGSVFSSLAGPGAGYSYTYSAVNTANGQVVANSTTSNFIGLAGGSYNIYGASYYSGAGPPTTVNPANWIGQTIEQVLTGGSCVLFSTNFKSLTVTGTPCANPPTVNAPTVTQPTCATPTGTIVVNANGAGTLEYSVNNGAVYQASNTFANLAFGNYNILVRLQADPTCTAAYAQNPVVLNAAMNCNGTCTDYVAMDVPIAISTTTAGTITSTVNVPTGGIITDVNIKNLNGTHTWVSDLTMTLMSPQGTPVVLFTNQCTDMDNFNIILDDQAPNALSCPISTGNTQMPQNALSAYNGQNPMGNWTLMVADAFDDDGGALNGWTLEICVQGGAQPGYTCATATEITAPGTFNAPGPNQGNGAIAGSGFVHANWYRFTPPMSGNIRISTCGLAGAGNQHNHVYHVNTTSCATLNLMDVIYTEDNGCTMNQTDGVQLDLPVTLGTPIYIEWDDALSSTPFTWKLEYLTSGPTCTDYVAMDLPKNIVDNMTIASTITVPMAGVITDVNIKNLNGTHAYVGDLTFTLMSPQATSVVLIQNQCDDDATGFNISLDDQSLNALTCPLSTGSNQMPQNALSAFNGQSPTGNWMLMINDNGDGDVGQLNGWTLEICVSGGAPCPPNLAVDAIPIVTGTYQAGTQLTSMGSIVAGGNVTFRAGNNVELRPNFEIAGNANFEIKIEGCQ